MFLNKKNNYFIYFCFLLLSLIFILFDIYYNKFNKIKLFFNNISFLFYNLHSKLYILIRKKVNYINKKGILINKNIKLIKKNLILKNKLYLINNLKMENYILYKFLNIPFLLNNKYSIVRILFNSKSILDELFINIFLYKNIKYGNLLFNGIGIIGKLIFYNKNFGKIQLICNNDSGFSGKILRNGLKVIISGNGCNNNMKILDLPINVDIKKGDIILNYDIYNYYYSVPIGIVFDVLKDNIYGGIIIIVKSFVNYIHNFDYGILFI